eukprot:Rhum_TRINITY_DN15496_c1_g1::Rhum_TRINITY_DN15496_c1_g1_i9::g.159984::m.159984
MQVQRPRRARTVPEEERASGLVEHTTHLETLTQARIQASGGGKHSAEVLRHALEVAGVGESAGLEDHRLHLIARSDGIILAFARHLGLFVRLLVLARLVPAQPLHKCPRVAGAQVEPPPQEAVTRGLLLQVAEQLPGSLLAQAAQRDEVELSAAALCPHEACLEVLRQRRPHEADLRLPIAGALVLIRHQRSLQFLASRVSCRQTLRLLCARLLGDVVPQTDKRVDADNEHLRIVKPEFEAERRNDSVELADPPEVNVATSSSVRLRQLPRERSRDVHLPVVEDPCVLEVRHHHRVLRVPLPQDTGTQEEGLARSGNSDGGDHSACVALPLVLECLFESCPCLLTLDNRLRVRVLVTQVPVQQLGELRFPVVRLCLPLARGRLLLPLAR